MLILTDRDAAQNEIKDITALQKKKTHKTCKCANDITSTSLRWHSNKDTIVSGHLSRVSPPKTPNLQKKKKNTNVRTQMFVGGAPIVPRVCTNESGQQERSTVRDAGWVTDTLWWPRYNTPIYTAKSKSAASQYLRWPIAQSAPGQDTQLRFLRYVLFTSLSAKYL